MTDDRPETPVDLPMELDALVLGAQSEIAEHVLQAALAIWRDQGRTHWWQVTGRSMLPLLCEGDQLKVQHGVQELRVGDIIIFHLHGQPLAHRIICIQGVRPHRLVTTRGDNATGNDPVIQEDAIIGRALAMRRNADEIRLDTGVWHVHGLVLVAWARLSARLVRILRPVKTLLPAGWQSAEGTRFYATWFVAERLLVGLAAGLDRLVSRPTRPQGR